MEKFCGNCKRWIELKAWTPDAGEQIIRTQGSCPWFKNKRFDSQPHSWCWLQATEYQLIIRGLKEVPYGIARLTEATNN